MGIDLKSFFESSDNTLKNITRKSKEVSSTNTEIDDTIREEHSSDVQPYHPDDYTHIEEKSDDKLYPVYINLFSNNTTAGKFIRKMTGTPYSHATVALDASMNNMYSFSALPYTKGVLGGDVSIGRESLWSPWYTSCEFFTVLVIFVDNEGRDAVQKKIDNFVRNVDKFEYNTLGCIEYYFGVKNLKDHDETTKNKWFCSEFVAACINSAGVPGFENIYMSPNDLSKSPNVISLGKYTLDSFDEKDLVKKTRKAEAEFRKKRTLDMKLEYGPMNESVVDHIRRMKSDEVNTSKHDRCTAFVDWKKLYEEFRKVFPRTNPSLRFPLFELIIDKTVRPAKVTGDKVTSMIVSELHRIRNAVKEGFIQLIDIVKSLIMFNNQGENIALHYPDDTVVTETCKSVSDARKFVSEVKDIATKYDANFFIVTDGASGIHNNGNAAVRAARAAHEEWERSHGEDPDEDWSKTVTKTETVDPPHTEEPVNSMPEQTTSSEHSFLSNENSDLDSLASMFEDVIAGLKDVYDVKENPTQTQTPANPTADESAGVMEFLPSVPVEQKVLNKSSMSDDLFDEDCNIEEPLTLNDATLVTETLEYNITKGFGKKEVILYHGSPYKLSKIMPRRVNYGTRLSKPRISSFWTDDMDSAAIRGFAAWIPDNIPESVRRTIFASEDIKNKKMYIVKSDLDKLKQWAANCIVYVHEAKVPTKYVGRGHDPILREYSVDIPVYTRRIYEYRFEDILKFIIATDESTVKAVAKKANVPPLLNALVYGDYKDKIRDRSFDMWDKQKLMKLPKEPAATKNGWFDNNHWNSLVVKGNKRYHERVETIICGYSGSRLVVFLRKKPDGTYELPGGSSEPGKSLMSQAIRECQEEVHITPVKMIYYGQYVKNWDKSKSYAKGYDGYIVHYFVAQYGSAYSGEARPNDGDNKMLKEGGWYPLLDISNILSEEHLTALEDYVTRITMNESAEFDDVTDEPTEEEAIEELRSSYESVFEFKNELADETLEVKTTKFAPRTLFIESANYHYPDIVHELVEDVLSDIESGNPDYAGKQSLVWRMTGENVVPLSAIAEDLGFVQIESILPADDEVTYAMDISKYTPEKSSYLSEAAKDLSHIFRADDEYIYLNVPYCEFYIPTEYFAMGKKFAEDFTDKINVIGLFNIGLFEDDKLVDVKVFNVPVYLDINVYDYDVRMIDVGSGTPVECRVYKYFKDAIICRSFIPENSSVAQTFLQLIISGSMPGTIPYSQCLSVWRKNLELSGVSLGVSSAVMEMILAVMYRDARDPSKKYCIRYGSSADSSEFDYMSASIRQICQYNSTFTGIIYEDIDSMITSAINRNRNGKEEGETPMEKIIKM